MADFIATDIVKEFETTAEPLRILDGVSMTLDRGQNVAVVGPSGSGKSTFLNIAGSLDQPTSGTIELLGENPVGMTPNELAHFRNHRIGFVFQQHHLLPQLSALENVLIPVLATKTVDSESENRGKELLKQVGLDGRASHRPAQMSGGEQQRVAVARALIQSPTLLLADEPTGSLDQRNAEVIGELLLKMQDEHNAILICVTHSGHLADKFQQRVVINDGKFVE